MFVRPFSVERWVAKQMKPVEDPTQTFEALRPLRVLANHPFLLAPERLGIGHVLLLTHVMVTGFLTGPYDCELPNARVQLRRRECDMCRREERRAPSSAATIR